ncbi:hypothetical protein [Flavilitoribacter nigricans]|uniref:hypothetical protein n=1 Tax=Flavilitoribacter nigricans TaxID=70997 RepID=UPI00117AFED7|nr:hypothetical protein [Flavilitoribacter nigricans]
MKSLGKVVSIGKTHLAGNFRNGQFGIIQFRQDGCPQLLQKFVLLFIAVRNRVAFAATVAESSP